MSVRRSIEFDEHDVNWLTETYGGGVSFSWVLGMLLKEFREAHKEKTPADLARVGAAELKRMLEESR